MTPPPTTRNREQGVALVTTVIVVAVLAVVAVAMMQSTTVDRLSARSVANYTRAKLAAEAGAVVAQSMVADLVTRYPDSATVWQNIGGGNPNGTSNEATVLYVRAQAASTNLGARPGQFGPNVVLLGQPLVSRTNATNIAMVNTNPVALSNVVSLLPFSATDASVVNINATNASRTEPFVGSRSMTNPGAPINAAQWIYMTKDGAPVSATNPYVARYAFWIEDESFKLNVNVAANGARGTTSLGLSPAEVRLDGSLQSSSNSAIRNINAGNVIAARASLPGGGFPTALTAALAGGLSDAQFSPEFRFLTTASSAGLDLSRGGFKRFNINSITNGDKREALNRVVAAITNTNAAPLFGQRFYRTANTPAGINNTSTVTTDHANIYLQKIAANIYDYLDADDQPTVINNDAAYSLRTGRPTEAIYAQGGGTDGDSSIAAMGVESLPRLQEYAIHARIRKMQWTNDPESFGFASTGSNAPSPPPTSADYEIWIDHYFEFWNSGTRGFTNTNASAFLQIDKLPAFLGSDPNDPISKERSITNISIPVGTVFPAGEVTVLTTAPLTEVSLGSAANFALLTNAANVVFLSVPDADRKFTGKTTAVKTFTYNSQSSFGPSFPYDKLFQVSLSPGPQTKASVLLGNSTGILESFVGLPVNAQQNVSAIGLDLTVTNGFIREGMAHVGLAAGNNDNIRGGSLRGNTNSSGASPVPFGSQGDPRALNEQLTFLNFSTTPADPDQTRFYVTVTGTAAFPEDSTMGRPNANFVNSTNWVDVSSLNPSNANAPLVVRNGSMQTIGELGHITDPARVAGGSGTISRARGGGRTLRIGQGEYSNTSTFTWYYGNQTLASRTWTSWRLADIFTATTNTNIAIPGLVNPNGALRDNGAALRAAFFGLTFLPAGPDGASSIAGRPANITNVVTNVISRLTNGAAGGLTNALNPFWERGEISELTVLNSAASGSLASGAVMSNAFDRGREELVRRSIEMITTRGSVCTVYAIGQSLQITATSTNVLSSARVKTTFELVPQFANPSQAFDDSFAPANAASRFVAPTNYNTRIISSTYD